MLDRLAQWTQPKLHARILADPYYRFQSLAEVALAADLGVRIDVNQASVDDWLRLPGLSIHQARQLVQLTHNGVQFYCIEDVAAALSLPVQRMQPLAAILQFCYYDSAALATTLNLNTATVEQLTGIPGMTSRIARHMIRDRIAHGPFQNFADLQQRINLSGETAQALLPYLRC
ncbi:ComEA family DNA-binding protein [Acaryochloris sp. IP29b_bin.137]|uniref:ComEA family DNA-binding protein n=1 Tax=Acaryochloris sp. IP29b_bin.137 TaxID=2969217 RepID=UPI002611582A|nr:ComEA family DNA-binding protein [Acaryochloris sp. IP29b_bin.137]